MLIALMTRIPEPGKTKTRLQSHLSSEECALLHQAFIQDMLLMLQKTSAAFSIFHTTDGDIVRLKKLVYSDSQLIPQKGKDLGERMYNALAWGFAQGFRKVAVLGTDLPALQPEVIDMADKLLDNKDVVIGPTKDGGYYFLGMKKPYPELFRKSNWGNSTVFQETINILQQIGLKWGQLPECNDIDYYWDLVELKDQIEQGGLKNIPINTYQLVKNLRIRR